MTAIDQSQKQVRSGQLFISALLSLLGGRAEITPEVVSGLEGSRVASELTDGVMVMTLEYPDGGES